MKLIQAVTGLLVGGTVLLSAAGAHAAASGPAMTALVGPGGRVTILEGTKEVATIEPGLFLKGWQYRGLGEGRPRPNRPDETETAVKDAGPVRLRFSVKAEGGTLSFRYAATPQADITVESVHVSINTPASDWAGAPFRFNETAGKIPGEFGNLHLAGGTTYAVSLGPNRAGLKAEVSFPVRGAGKAGAGRASLAPGVGIQDNRQWADALEIRIGDTPEGGTWKAGKEAVVAFKLKLNRRIKVEHDKPVVMKAGPDWSPLRGTLEIEPGSALDWSTLGFTRTTAGAYGWLRRGIARPAALEFEKDPGKPARFYGVNLCFTALFPSHAQSDRLAERLARLGYNSVRIHHYESMSWSTPPGLVDPKAPDSLTFHQEALDRLDYLFAALKKRGLYMTTDLYVNRAVKTSEIFDGGTGDVAYRFKHLVHVSDRALDNMKEFSRRLLGHVNPYTGQAYRDDPALAWISLINEGNLANNIADLREDKREADLWDAAFEKWKKEKSVTAEWGGDACKRFLWETQQTTQRRIIRFLREELGVKSLLTDLNGWSDEWGTEACRADFDYVDNHFYWDHPNFIEKAWALPARGGSGGGSAIAAGGGFARLGLTRLADRPFTVSEFNFCGANPYRAEGGLLMGAFAAIQDWSVLWRFTYSHGLDNMFRPSPLGDFDNATDPLNMASDRAGIMLFLRGDAAPANHLVAVTGEPEEWWKSAHRWVGGDLDLLGWCVRIGSQVGTAAPDLARLEVPLAKGFEKGSRETALAGLKARGMVPTGNATDPAKGIYQSDTGEVTLDTKAGVLVIATPRTAAVAGPEGTKRIAGILSVDLKKSWAAVWASSLDEKPLAESDRIVLAHLTDMKNTGMKYRSRKLEILEEWGRTPYLVKAGTGWIKLAHARPRTLKVWKLALDGKRMGRVETRVKDKALQFQVSTSSKTEARIYYEIAVR